MTAYVALALFAEGMTDHWFLQPLLRRTTENLCLERPRGAVEVATAVVELHSPTGTKHVAREERILEAAREAAGSFSILFVHTDAAGDAVKARQERVDPACRRISAELSDGQGTVGVVPVRETEAWTLVDGDALRRAFGTTANDADLGLPARPHDVESIPDPKRVLRQGLALVRGGRRGQQHEVKRYLPLIAGHIDLARLRTVPAFSSMEDELRHVLETQHVIEPASARRGP